MVRHDVPTVSYDRWYEIWQWCQSIGCCVSCATNAACAIVQREALMRSWGKPPTDCCKNKHIAPEHCLELVRTNWANAPKQKDK